MNRWYRAYEGTVTDPKLGEVAMVAECSRSVAIAVWHCILESAACQNEGGTFDATPRRIAVILGEPISTIEAIFSELEALNLIKSGEVTSWKKRQYESDSSTERSRKHRATKRNGDATLQDRCATPPETETETYNPPTPQAGVSKTSIPSNWSPPDLADLPVEASACATQWPPAAYRAQGEAFANQWKATGRSCLDWGAKWAAHVVKEHAKVMRDQKFGQGPPETKSLQWTPQSKAAYLASLKEKGYANA